MNNSKILIIFTGGTISMKNDDILNKSIMMTSTVNLKTILIDVFSAIEFTFIEHSLMPSPWITPNDMFNLAKLIEMNINHYDGIVVTHGTDTIEETAYFIDQFLATKTPIVFTGSMRNLSELGYDGLNNIVSSVLVAINEKSKNRGVLLVFNDEINSISEVTKTHTLALDTFKSLEFGPLGIVDQRDVLYYREYTKNKQKLNISKLTKRVEIIKCYSGMDPTILDFMVDNKVDGIIIEAFGRGNVPPSLVPGIRRAIAKSIPIVITSRSFKGRVLDTYAYEGGGHQLKEIGVLFGGNLNAQKARIKLLLAINFYSDPSNISKLFKS